MVGGAHSQTNVSFLALTAWKRQCLDDSEEKDELVSQSTNDKGVWRTAPATPGLLNKVQGL